MNNYIHHNVGNGIWISYTPVYITLNVIAENKYGIWIYDSFAERSIVYLNKFFENTENSIYLGTKP